jgi:hypothetical protein
LQNAQSLADQKATCRRFAEALGWQVLGTYEDARLSGASRFRPEYQRLLADAEAHWFDLVVCEALNRLAEFTAALADDGAELRKRVRGPVETIRLIPEAGRLRVEVRGELGAILRLAEGVKAQKYTGSVAEALVVQVNGDEGTGYGLCRTPLRQSGRLPLLSPTVQSEQRRGLTMPGHWLWPRAAHQSHANR